MRSLRAVILQRIAIVAVVSFLLSAGFTYYYYRTILVDQMIHDDQSKLSQTSRQLQYMSDDISQFASSLIISDRLQTFFKTYHKADTFDKFALLQDTFNYLNENKGLRKEVSSYAIVMPSGETFWSEARYDSYFADRMEEPWYLNFVSSSQGNGFTEPHQMFFNALTESKTISYIVKVKDISKIGSEIGVLILNLDYSNFESVLGFGGADFDGLLWLNGSNHLLYGKQPPPETLDHVSLADAAAEPGQGSYRPLKGGYMLIDRLAENGWKLVTFTSGHSMVERAKVVIYLLGVFSLTSTILILLLIMSAILRITGPIMQLYHAMNAASIGNLQASVTIRSGDELEKLGQGFNRMIEQLRVYLEESIQHEKEKKNMELELLLSQLNPHFVYNTLNAVIYMAQKQGNDDIVKMVGSFIRILQDAVKMGGAQSMVPLQDDMAMLRDYLAIQSYRYADMFTAVWDIDEQAKACLIPRNLVQPFVENAIFHGICPKDAPGTIRLTASACEDKLVITVADDGVGMDAEQLAAVWEPRESRRSPGLRHIGLPNTKRRLEHLFGDQARLIITSSLEEGTAVRIEMPAILAQPAKTTAARAV
ncbi:sensor histidine kinase [Paenibacillus sp. R14(2021)]|uniref:sensor histidine kinase n=1 Tax=Paenibacillus sp. R14(2021) TaxID=2859228 RepID=UPI001C61544B|nr:histidine kinase [Paenibacillus sp. R14(2021)]